MEWLSKNNGFIKKWSLLLTKQVSIAPLVTFRIVFGSIMVFSTLRFWWLGWIEDHFINTQFTFKYFGFAWVQLLPPTGMYLLHALLLLGAIGITLGLFYRLSAIVFFLAFTYVELIDLTYYLNHYYFVTLISFLLIWVPANRLFSLDVYRGAIAQQQAVPRWTIAIFQLQIGIVYTYAGLAKVNADWLFHALPLKIWLPAHTHLPIVGKIFTWEITAYLFSWIGLLYDLLIVFFLMWKPTRVMAYLSVVAFHTLTGLLFQIGIFPLVMIGGTWIFFPERFHQKLLQTLTGRFKNSTFRARLKVGFAGEKHQFLKPLLGYFFVRLGSAEMHSKMSLQRTQNLQFSLLKHHLQPSTKLIAWILASYFLLQLLIPWRYLLYPGNLFWTEEGYRFSWRVMLVEKAGTATFYVKDPVSGREGMVDNSQFLRPQQERLMAYQPDMILQFAHFLARHFQKEGEALPAVSAEVYVTLNGRPSRLLIDPKVNLALVQDGWGAKDWIIRE